MKLLTVCVFFLVPLLGYSQRQMHRDDWALLKEQTKALRDELARQGAYAFVTNRETTPSVAPYIHSQCWVDWLPKTNVEQIAYEQEKRDFGLDLVGELEKLALLDIPLDDIDALENQAVQMLTIAEWLKTSAGYGNYILKKWSEGVALSSMGGMAVSEKCDTNRIIRLLGRIDDLKINVAWQVGILNEESPHKYRIPTFKTLNEAIEGLEDQWNVHLKRSLIWCKNKTGRYTGLSFESVKGEDHEYAFYVKDRCQGMYDIVRHWWNKKNHEQVCVYGLSEVLVDDLAEVLKFRNCAGEIPVPNEAAIQNDLAALDYQLRLKDIWQAKTHSRDGFKGAFAVISIYRGTFGDWNTRRLRLLHSKR